MSNTDAWCTVQALWAPRGRLDLENWTDSLPSDSLLFFFPCSLWIRRVLTSVLLWWITQTLPWWAPGTILTAHASTICQFASTMQVRYSSLCLREPLYHKDLIWNEFAADVISNIHCTVVPMPTWDDTFENVIKAFFFSRCHCLWVFRHVSTANSSLNDVKCSKTHLSFRQSRDKSACFHELERRRVCRH